MANEADARNGSDSPRKKPMGRKSKKSFPASDTADAAIQNAKISNTFDLGRPPLGWMPRAKVRDLIIEIDAELKASRSTEAGDADV